MERDLRHHLSVLAARFAEAKGMEASTVGRLAAGDWRFFTRINDGSSFTARKYDEVVGWFATNWPTGTRWPEGVPRPVDGTQEAA